MSITHFLSPGSECRQFLVHWAYRVKSTPIKHTPTKLVSMKIFPCWVVHNRWSENVSKKMHTVLVRWWQSLRKRWRDDTESWYLALTCLLASSSPSSSVLGSVTGCSSSSSSYSSSFLRSDQGKRHAVGWKERRWKKKLYESPETKKQPTKSNEVRIGRKAAEQGRVIVPFCWTRISSKLLVSSWCKDSYQQ